MQLHFNAITPALTNIQTAFPGRSKTEIVLVLTAAAISVIPAMFFAGLLATKIREKKIILSGFLLLTISGVLSIFTTNFILLIALRALTGFGVGITAPFQTSIIPKYFTGYKADRLFGMQCFFASLFGMFYGVLGGWLAGIHWNFCFFIYVLGIAGIVIIQTFLPEGDKPVAVLDTSHFRLKPSFLVLMVILLFYAVISFSFNTNISYVLTEWKIGNSGTVGVCVALTGMGGMIAGLCYGQIYKRLKFLVIPSGLAVVAIGFFFISTKSSLTMILFGSLLIGMSNGMIMPSCLKLAATLYNAHQSVISTALLLSVVSLAQFISPFASEMMKAYIGISTYQLSYVVYALFLFIFAIGTALLSKRIFSV
jgi:MFS family permease